MGEPASMCVADGACGLLDQRERATRREHDSGEPCFGNKAGGIEAGDELDGGERLTLRDAELTHPCDPWMLEAAVRTRGRRQCLRDSTDGEIRRKALHRELTFESCDAENFGARHHAGGPAADGLQELVAPDALGRRF